MRIISTFTSKALSPISVTEFGITTEVNLLLEKARPPISVTELGIFNKLHSIDSSLNPRRTASLISRESGSQLIPTASGSDGSESSGLSILGSTLLDSLGLLLALFEAVFVLLQAERPIKYHNYH